MDDVTVFLVTQLNDPRVSAFLGGMLAIIGKALATCGWQMMRKSAPIYSEAAQNVFAILDAAAAGKGRITPYVDGTIARGLVCGRLFIIPDSYKYKGTRILPEITIAGDNLLGDLTRREQEDIFTRTRQALTKHAKDAEQDGKNRRLAKLKEDGLGVSAASSPVELVGDVDVELETMPKAVGELGFEQQNGRRVVTENKRA